MSMAGNGQIVDEEQAPILGHYYADGLPIVNSLPYAEFTADGNIVEALLPEAAAALQLGSSFTLRFDRPYYAPHSQGAPLMERHDGTVALTVEKAVGAELLSDTTFVTRVEPAGVPESWSVSHVIEPDDLLSAIRRQQELTSAECAALQQIVDHLDEIKAAQDAASPGAPVATE